MNNGNLDRRIESLEQRLARIEQFLRIPGGQPSAADDADDVAAEELIRVSRSPATVEPPAPAPPVLPLPMAHVESLPPEGMSETVPYAPITLEDEPPTMQEPIPYAAVEPAPAVQQSGFEQTVGLKWAGWIGAIVLVIGAGLGIKFAVDQGWLGQIPAGLRLALMSLFGFALIGVGEIVLRRVNAVAAAGIYGAGVATLFLVSLAGHALYDLYTPGRRSR